MKLPAPPPRKITEAGQKQAIRAHLSALPGVLCFPNAVGEYDKTDESTGRVYHIVYGLAVGSSDLVLCMRGRFVVIECKKVMPRWLVPDAPGGWKVLERPKPTKHEQEQIDFIRMVERCGGVGGFAWDVESAMAIVTRV